MILSPTYGTSGPDSLYDSLGDTGSAILPDGRLLCSNWGNANTDIYDPTTNAWTDAAPMSTSTGDEETWNSLPDGTVLSTFLVGQRYIPSQNTWLATAPIPVSLVDADSEMGPVLMLYDGRALALGATGHTAFFTLPTTLTGAGSWAAGPDMPSGLSAPDTPACVEVNGKVLCVGTPSDFGATNFLEFDPGTNTFAAVAAPGGFNQSSDAVRMLALPNGQVLMTAGYQNAWVYSPVGGPQPSWAPAVASVVANSDGTYTVAGTQLNGLTNGGAYGDEANPYTHYPIVSLVDSSGNVHFARTFNFSQMNPSLPGGQQSAQFRLPAGLPTGTYNLYVTASGVSSAAFSYTVGLPPGPYRITPQNRTDLALDINAFVNSDNAIVQLWYANYGPGQQWLLDRQSDGSYIIRAFGGQNSVQVLDDTGGGTGDGNPVETYHDNGLTTQRWNIVTTGGGWCRIVPVNAPGQTLDMRNGNSATAGSAANLYHFTGTGNQLFRFDSATPPPLQVSNVAVSAVTTSSATVTWTTNITADDAVDYGLTSSYGSTTTGTGSQGSTDNHSVTLSGLVSGTVYHYRVRSTDLNGRTATSADATFTTTTQATSVTVTSATGTAGQSVMLTARLKRSSDGAFLSGKALTFKIDGVTVGTAATHSSGSATLTYTLPGTTTAGSHVLTASFAGDSAYNASTGTGTLTVTSPKINTTLTLTNATGAHGQAVMLTARLRRVSDNAALSGETVTFKVDGSVVGSAVTHSSGSATLTYTLPVSESLGSHVLSASFAGDSGYNPSSATGTLTVH